MDLMNNAEICSLMEEVDEITFDSDTVCNEIVKDYSKDVDDMIETVFGDDSIDDNVICEDVDFFDVDDREIDCEEDHTSEFQFIIQDKLEPDSRKNRRTRDKSKWRKTIERLEKREARRGKQRQIPNCRCMCSKKMSENEQKSVYKSFNDLETNDEQNLFLRKSIISMPSQRHRSRKGTYRCRRVFNYYVNSEDRKISVCLSAFTAILGIKRSRLMRKIQSQNDENGVIDGRGKHGNQKRIDPSVRKSVKNFLDKLPTFGSRYVISEDKIQKYLHPELSVLSLHRNFIKNYENSLTYQAFRGIFRNELKYSFCFARCNSCKICNKPEFSLDNVAEELHMRRVDQFTEILRSYKHSFENLVICFDYQNDLPVPVTNTSSDYYKHHLKIYNFGIHNIITNSTDMFMYSEHFARKEVDEVLSCLNHYIHRNWQKQNKKLIIFCDNWCNQTKNEIFFVYLNQLCILNVFEEVIVYYPISGHSSMPIHTKFESVEKKLKVCRSICSPEKYVEIVRETKRGKRFSIHYVQHSLEPLPYDDEKIVKVLNWKEHYSHFINSPIRGIWNCRMAQFIKGHDPIIRSTYDGPDIKINLHKKGFSKMNYTSEEPSNKYSNFLPITPVKLNDIEHLLKISGMSSNWSKEFYSSIPTSLEAEDTNIDAYE